MRVMNRHSTYRAILSPGTPNEAVTSCDKGRASDPKWRFFWRIGERNTSAEFPEDSAAPVVPEQFPGWETTMNDWGSHMLSAVKTVAEMLARGLDLDPFSITRYVFEVPVAESTLRTRQNAQLLRQQQLCTRTTAGQAHT